MAARGRLDRGKKLSGTVEAPAGGWWTLEVRVTREGKELAAGRVGKVGIGEVFVVAGQSNFGQPRRGKTNATDRSRRFLRRREVASRRRSPAGCERRWRQFPAAAGRRTRAETRRAGRFVACGIGATSVREWLPKGATFPNPPTIESRVEKRPDGLWMSKGDAYQIFLARIKPLGPRGFRAVLWHQGESDANQKDPTAPCRGIFTGSLSKRSFTNHDARSDGRFPVRCAGEFTTCRATRAATTSARRRLPSPVTASPSLVPIPMP